VLLGCNASFILPQIDSHYVLIGVCFVLGLMGGEAIQELKEGKVHFQSFNQLTDSRHNYLLETSKSPLWSNYRPQVLESC
jgi:hypothetical protein